MLNLLFYVQISFYFKSFGIFFVLSYFFIFSFNLFQFSSSNFSTSALTYYISAFYIQHLISALCKLADFF